MNTERLAAADPYAAELAARYDRMAECAETGHEPYHAARAALGATAVTDCPGCGQVLASPTDADGWADHAAEMRAEARGWEAAQAAEARDDKRWGRWP